MKKLIWFSLLLLVASCGENPVQELREWAANPVKSIDSQSFAKQPLDKVACHEAAGLVDSLWTVAARKRLEGQWNSFVMRHDTLQMKFAWRELGEMPADGRSLYISMHGGGGCPAPFNDQQWKNQIYLYTPAEGIYVAPRAPWNTYDLWHKEGLDELFESLIQSCVVYLGVNPDKVYLVGYSAGGDGVWRMAPRMADRWAAASMMAGHPGAASQVNLRNTPYMIWMGENDAAYDRNRLAAEKGKLMDSLQQADPSGYIHETHIVSGKGHWMDRADTAAIPWMAQYRRNPYPEKIVWRQEKVGRKSFYWLSAPEKELKRGMRADVERKGNDIFIRHCDYSALTLYLNDEMFDLDAPVRVYSGDRLLFEGKVRRTISSLYRTMYARGDRSYMFPAEIEVKL